MTSPGPTSAGSPALRLRWPAITPPTCMTARATHATSPWAATGSADGSGGGPDCQGGRGVGAAKASGLAPGCSFRPDARAAGQQPMQGAHQDERRG
jgi:hypothetical protein